MVPNQHLIGRIHSEIVADASTIPGDSPSTRYELYTHANMIVIGNNYFVFDSVHGRTVDVAPFYSSLGFFKNITIVDDAVAYDCLHNHKTCILLDRNSIHVPSMRNGMIPPFIVRESGALFHDAPNINVNDPGVNDNLILFHDSNLQIQLQLWGILSLFHSRVPTYE